MLRMKNQRSITYHHNFILCAVFSFVLDENVFPQKYRKKGSRMDSSAATKNIWSGASGLTQSVDVSRQDLAKQMALDLKLLCQLSSPMSWTLIFHGYWLPRSFWNLNLNSILKEVFVRLVLLKVWMCSYNMQHIIHKLTHSDSNCTWSLDVLSLQDLLMLKPEVHSCNRLIFLHWYIFLQNRYSRIICPQFIVCKAEMRPVASLPKIWKHFN